MGEDNFLGGLFAGSLFALIFICVFALGMYFEESEIVRNVETTGMFYHDTDSNRIVYTCTIKK